MRWNMRAVVAVLLCELLIAETAAVGGQAPKQAGFSASPVSSALNKDLQKSYLDLFRESPEFTYTAAEIQKMRGYLKQARESCVTKFKREHDRLGTELQKTRAGLRENTGKLSDSERHDLHCRIQNVQALEGQTDVLANHAIPVAYQNRQAKLDLIEQWPGRVKQIGQQIADGSYHNRQWGDVKDIGFRQIRAGQEDDIKVGQEAIRQMRASGLMPKEVENKAVVDYVTALGEKIAAHSDLHVPLHITVLNSKEVNAFALPGGYLFIERGLLDAADNESELAGVIAHEMAHDVARHAKQLMKKATIASIIYQAAQVAALILTGGVAGIGTYYALQYGFYGLGLVLSLQLLGVSRDFELQADQLGIQYAWNSGYAPDGFIQFFDKMATKEGYINGVSWFRTHPTFYQRMADAEREIRFLPEKENLVVQTTDFEQMKKELVSVVEKASEEEKGRPSLIAAEQGCPPPKKIEYTPGQPIEALCSLPVGHASDAKK